VTCDAEQLCEALVGDALPAHVLLVGVAYQHGVLPLAAEAIEEAIGEMGRDTEGNLAAFRWGRAVVVAPEVVAAAIAEEPVGPAADRQPSSRAQAEGDRLLALAELPGPTRDLVDWRLKDLVDYQSAALATSYLETVKRVVAVERRAVPGSTDLSEAVARYLYKLLAYKDEYEVARLHLDPAFQRQMQGDFPGASVRYKLHPPILRAFGLKKKLALRPNVILPTFRVLREMRRLRGTALDPFGHAKVRRVERRLIEDYRSAVDSILVTLSPERYDEAVELASLPEIVRGYEGIKLRNVKEFDRRLSELEDRLKGPA
jgi:indolepyruvate ferredoxin oxidoreductase